MLGTMVIILGSLLSIDAFAGHSSHRSHRSHSSHRSSSHSSHSSHSSATHSNHSNHGSHESHVSHVSHTSHSNTTAHSNSLYSSEGDVTYSAPAASTVKGVTTSPVATTSQTFKLPTVNENIEIPNGTPGTQLLPNLAVPQATPSTEIDADALHTPPEIEDID